MASASQQRCVFVGNIPYDATEEQLIQICEEVGPVVSFRLVIDRETGKPKGYGFCEYKDEETALSARRNLQGYEINGRQLRVDFAENDKGADRNREQGRGGPGMAVNVDPKKQLGGPAILGDSANQQPIGLSLATAAASVMAGALGGAQVGSKANQSGPHNQAFLGGDPLTLHLAKMSRSQLNDILSELKGMATENKELARQLLVASPQLPKALFQAQIMLGMVTPEVLQTPSLRQAPGPLLQRVLRDDQQGQDPAVQATPGLPPFAQNKMRFGMIPDGQASAMPPNLSVPDLMSAAPQLHSQPRIQQPHFASGQVQQASFPSQSGVSALPAGRPQPLPSLSTRPQIQSVTSSLSKQQMQAPLLQHPAQSESAHPGHSTQQVNPRATIPPTLLSRPPITDPSFQKQVGSTMILGVPDTIKKNAAQSGQATDTGNWGSKINNISNSTLGPLRASMVQDTSEPLNRPSKLLKLNDGRSNPQFVADLNVPTETRSESRPSQELGVDSSSINQVSKAVAQPTESQFQLPPEVESALLQQVMNLTPEQLSSLPPEQQQQVIQLQQMLR